MEDILNILLKIKRNKELKLNHLLFLIRPLKTLKELDNLIRNIFIDVKIEFECFKSESDSKNYTKYKKCLGLIEMWNKKLK